MSTNADAPINTVLVGYASAYGSTKGVATRIAERLRAACHTVELAPVDGVESVEPYGAAVVGSAIHNQQWLPPAVEFVQRHTAALSTRPLWMFSVCSVGETTTFLGDRPTRMAGRHRKDPATIGTGPTSIVGPMGSPCRSVAARPSARRVEPTPEPCRTVLDGTPTDLMIQVRPRNPAGRQLD